MDMSIEQTRDLISLEIINHFDKSEIISALTQLKWLGERDNFSRILELTHQETLTNDIGKVYAYVEERLKLIQELKVNGMRLDDGSLSSAFVSWYDCFCSFNSSSRIRKYSLQAINLGDHPAWENLAIEIPGNRRGGQPDRQSAHIAAGEAVVAYIIRRHGLANPTKEELWPVFIDKAQEYEHIKGINYTDTPVEFVPDSSASGGDFLWAIYTDTDRKEQKKKYVRGTFFRALKKLKLS